MKRLLAVLISASLCVSMIGCGGKSGSEKYELVPALTTSELNDYYEKAYSKESDAARLEESDQTSWVEKPAEGSTREAALARYAETQNLLGLQEYIPTDEQTKILPVKTWGYVKSRLDDRVLSNPEVLGVTHALGFYFVDVKYEVSTQDAGYMTNLSQLVGINGAFKKSAIYGDSVDTAYMIAATKKLNEYYEENGIDKKVGVNSDGTLNDTGNSDIGFGNASDMGGNDLSLNPLEQYDEFGNPIEQSEVTEGEGADSSEYESADKEDVESSGSNEDEVAESDGSIEENLDTEENADIASNETYDNSSLMKEIGITHNLDKNNRTLAIDINEFEDIVGASVKNRAYIPDLKMVYSAAPAKGIISGFGIIPSGGIDLDNFGYDRSQFKGEEVLRYVYKEDVNQSGVLQCVNVYEKSYTLSTDIPEDGSVLIPDYLREEFEKLVERADRARMNNDIHALASGDIYNDLGFAILNGYTHNVANVMSDFTTIKRIVARDDLNSMYLLELEGHTQEGSQDADVYGSYKDKWYIVIKENDSNKFVITDAVKVGREILVEPDINPDSSTDKRLAALNMLNELTDEDKEAIAGLVSDLYKACSYKILEGPKEITQADGSKVTIERGMYDCFNDDVSLLSSDRKEYLNSNLRRMIVAHGNNVKVTFQGEVTDWIGGNSRQAEFTTVERLSYEGYPNKLKLECYYLVSNINDRWVIDDIKVLSQEEEMLKEESVK